MVRSKPRYLLLTVACSLALVFWAMAAMANPDPAPTWQDLALADNYGHVTSAFNSATNTFTFTVFNDQTGFGNNICGFAVYPTATLNGVVPVVNGPTPPGWISTGWEGPITGLGPQFGNIRDAFTVIDPNSPVFQIPPGGSLNSFSFQWVGSTLPTDLKFGVEVCRPSGAFWAQSGPNVCPPPIPDASSLVLAGTGAMMLLPALRRSLRRRVA